VPSARRHLFLAGLTLNLGNPKSIVFFLALLPSVVDLGTLTSIAFVELATVIVAVIGGVLGGYVVIAARMRRLFGSPRAIRLVNRGSGIALAGPAAVVATR
jgi:threonine/homoserine/homoserine lactone efflux protein